ncbi:BnaCnng50600D [Brassica napus]|uniref:(rape) hypothetical protein n=2 Tax=Brassica napus TaxID=3708 RepID=A0A078JFM1_BRANA|nr:unnamed protein product [Brassica napus]CDY66378.1 BnaCnng50600D [Brassica napus]
MLRLDTFGIRILKTNEEINLHNARKKLEIDFDKLHGWSYIPVGGSFPHTEQKNLAFGVAASIVHPATAPRSSKDGSKDASGTKIGRDLSKKKLETNFR